MQDEPPSAQPASVEDADMEDDTCGNEEEEEETEVQRVKIVRPFVRAHSQHVGVKELTGPQLPGSTDTAASFEFTDEGHTLGNALRYIIMKK